MTNVRLELVCMCYHKPPLQGLALTSLNSLHRKLCFFVDPNSLLVFCVFFFHFIFRVELKEMMEDVMDEDYKEG